MKTKSGKLSFAIIALVVSAWLGWCRDARAQLFQNDRLMCGGRAFDLSAPKQSVSPNDLRTRALEVLTPWVNHAVDVCGQAPAPIGCAYFSKILADRAAERAAGRSTGRLDEELEPAARRVFANEACESQTSNDCRDLRIAERSRSSKPLSKEGIEALAKGDNRRFLHEAEADDEATPLPSSSIALVRRLSPEPPKSPCVAPLNDVCVEVAQVKSEAIACSQAEWYWSPFGQWRSGGIWVDPSNGKYYIDLCLDIGTRDAEALEVTLGRGGSVEVERRPGGVRRSVYIPTEGDVLSVLVRARPDGFVIASQASKEFSAADQKHYLVHEELRTLTKRIEGARQQEAATQLEPDLVEKLIAKLRTDTEPARKAFEKALVALSTPPTQLTSAVFKTARDKFGTLRSANLDNAAKWRNEAKDEQEAPIRARIYDKLSLLLSKLAPGPEASETPEAYAKRLTSLLGTDLNAWADLRAAFAPKPPTSTPASGTPVPSPSARLNEIVSSLCYVSNQYIEVGLQDSVVAPNADVIDFDFSRGLLGAKIQGQPAAIPTRGRHFNEERPLFVRVHQVPAKGSVLVELDGKTVAQSRPGVLGLAETNLPSARAVAAVPGRDSAFVPELTGNSNTLVVRVEPLPGGRRYELRICAGIGVQTKCDGTAANVLGKHTLPISGKFYLGVRFGFGLNVAQSDKRVPVFDSSRGTDKIWIVGTRKVEAEFSLPLTFAWYPGGRDPIDPSLAIGLTTGVELSAPLDRLYPLGLAFDYGGAGIGVSLSLAKGTQADVSAGRQIVSATKPNLESDFGVHTEWRYGGLVWLTMDADIFRTIFGAAFGSKLPTLGSM